MKTPRFFILFGALALVFTIASQTMESTARPASVESLPIMRADPWAGDPDIPGVKYQIPFEDESNSALSRDLQTNSSTDSIVSRDLAPWSYRHVRRLVALFLSRRW